MRLNFDIVMMIISILIFCVAYFFDRDNIYFVGILISILYWGLLYFICRDTSDALVSRGEE